MKKIELISLIAHSSSEIFWWMLFGLAVVELKCVLTSPPQKKKSGSTPEHYNYSVVSDHLGGMSLCLK